MKLCVLGPADNTAERNTAIVKRAFPELEVYQVSYQVYTEALDLIDEIQEEADAILFPGKVSSSRLWVDALSPPEGAG